MIVQVNCYIKNSIISIIYNCTYKFMYGNIICVLLLISIGQSAFGILTVYSPIFIFSSCCVTECVC